MKVRPAGDRGMFVLGYRPGRPGALAVRAVHRATPQLGTAHARAARLCVVTPSAAAGARGPLVRLLQRGLARLGYAVPRGGAYDASTARAVMAWRKVRGLPRAFVADERVVRGVLAGRGAFKPRYPRAGHHVEADLSRQVLALIDRGRVLRTYHVSSGAPASPTVVGHFRVYLKTPGINQKGMLHSSYFTGNYAIHGYASVPPFPASHGCLRVPIPGARHIFDWLRYGDQVIVYP